MQPYRPLYGSPDRNRPDIARSGRKTPPGTLGMVKSRWRTAQAEIVSGTPGGACTAFLNVDAAKLFAVVEAVQKLANATNGEASRKAGDELSQTWRRCFGS